MAFKVKNTPWQIGLNNFWFDNCIFPYERSIKLKQKYKKKDSEKLKVTYIDKYWSQTKINWESLENIHNIHKLGPKSKK